MVCLCPPPPTSGLFPPAPPCPSLTEAPCLLWPRLQEPCPGLPGSHSSAPAPRRQDLALASASATKGTRAAGISTWGGLISGLGGGWVGLDGELGTPVL